MNTDTAYEYNEVKNELISQLDTNVFDEDTYEDICFSVVRLLDLYKQVINQPKEAVITGNWQEIKLALMEDLS